MTKSINLLDDLKKPSNMHIKKMYMFHGFALSLTIAKEDYSLSGINSTTSLILQFKYEHNFSTVSNVIFSPLLILVTILKLNPASLQTVLSIKSLSISKCSNGL